jgi:hypothetical protein
LDEKRVDREPWLPSHCRRIVGGKVIREETVLSQKTGPEASDRRVPVAFRIVLANWDGRAGIARLRTGFFG